MTIKSRSRVRLALAVLAALAVAGPLGCGRLLDADSPVVVGEGPAGAPGPEPTPESTTAESATAVDPCSLISDEEAERLAGTSLRDPVPVRDTCTWTAPPTGPTAQVEVFVGDGAKKYLDIERELGHEIWPLPGVGDEAYAEEGTVFVHKGGTWVSIRLTLLSYSEETRVALAELARAVAGRL
jgi:hypothetical protein